jgi:single-strand DNA-binding protein
MAATATRTAGGGAADEQDAAAAAVEPVNEVRLVGRWHGAQERELPSGDVVLTARVVVTRAGGGVDTVDCAVWRLHLRRRVLGWAEGADVEVSGSLRRRFWRTPGGPASRYEVEVATAKLVRGAGGSARRTSARTSRAQP